MHSYLKIALWIAFVVVIFAIFPALLIIALLILLWWLLSNLSEHGSKWLWWQRDAFVLSLGKYGWFRRLPWLSSFLHRLEREQARRKERNRRKQAEVEARAQKEHDQARKEYDAFVGRPVPPDIKRDMRAFLDGRFIGEDRSPLAYVGYRVGKTRGLLFRERQQRLEVCFRIEIPTDLDSKYQQWGAPATFQRFRSIEKHLKMLADMRSSRSNQRFAVADWQEDRSWFLNEFQKTAEIFRRHLPKKHW
jgi:hypothetical protein